MVWTQKKLEKLIELAPNHTVKEMAEILGIRVDQVRNKINREKIEYLHKQKNFLGAKERNISIFKELMEFKYDYSYFEEKYNISKPELMNVIYNSKWRFNKGNKCFPLDHEFMEEK